MKRSKINRFLSLICALAMVVSATSVPAFADDQPEEPGAVMTEPVAGQTEQDTPVQTPTDEPSAEPEQEPEETVEYTFELETAVPEIAPLADFGQSDSSTLNESEKILYNSIREKIEIIAREGGSSEFVLTGGYSNPDGNRSEPGENRAGL